MTDLSDFNEELLKFESQTAFLNLNTKEERIVQLIPHIKDDIRYLELNLYLNDSNIIFKNKSVYTKKLYFGELKNSIDKLGFNGTWKVFFNSIEQCFSKEKGLSITCNSSNKDDDNENNLNKFILNMHLPLSDSINITYKIELEEKYNKIKDKDLSIINNKGKNKNKSNKDEIKNSNINAEELLLEEYKNLFFSQTKLILSLRKELQETKVLLNNTKKDIKIEHSDTNSLNSNAFNKKKQLEVKKNKRKFKSDLVNPNAKRRNVKGIQFIIEEESDS